MMVLDLSGLEEWTDEEVMEALNEVESGMTDNQLMWIERYNDEMANSGCLSDRQREVAENILTEWNAQA